MKMAGEEVNVKPSLKGNRWLGQNQAAFATLTEKGIVVDKLLGEGEYTKVKSAYHKKLGKKVAVKIIDKRKAPKDYADTFLQREVSVISELDHPNIIKMLGIFENNNQVFMIMELAEGGDLLDFVNKRKYEDCEEIRKQFQQIASAINYVHEQGVVHRDLKLENFVLDAHGNIKLTDFGFARRSMKDDLIGTVCGTMAYSCPEILRGQKYNGFAADVWSMGIVLYSMLCYVLPFGESELKAIAKGDDVKKRNFAKDTPIGAKDLILKMLDIDESKRIHTAEILKHIWLQGAFADSKGVHETASNTAVKSTMAIKGQIARYGDDAKEKVEKELSDDEENEGDTQTMAVRRSTLTSANAKQRKGSSIGKSKQKKQKESSAEKQEVKGTIKYKDAKPKNEGLANLVSKIVKAKKKIKEEKRKERSENGNSEERESDDDPIDELRDVMSDMEKEEATTSTDKTDKLKDAKVRKWKKVCGKMLNMSKN